MRAERYNIQQQWNDLASTVCAGSQPRRWFQQRDHHYNDNLSLDWVRSSYNYRGLFNSQC